jgi:hypothetical protein
MDIWMNDRRLCARAPGATPRYDGEAARKAGIPFVGVLSGGSPKQELKQAQAVAIFKDPADLLFHWAEWRDLVTQQLVVS